MSEWLLLRLRPGGLHCLMVTDLKSKRKCVAAVKAANTELILKNKQFEQMEISVQKNPERTHKKGSSAFLNNVLLICRHIHTHRSRVKLCEAGMLPS